MTLLDQLELIRALVAFIGGAATACAVFLSAKRFDEGDKSLSFCWGVTAILTAMAAFAAVLTLKGTP